MNETVHKPIALEGALAFMRGKKLSDNPFDPIKDIDRYSFWRQAWEAEKRDFEEKFGEGYG